MQWHRNITSRGFYAFSDECLYEFRADHQRLALPALVGLGPLMSLGLLAVGPSDRRLALFDFALAAAEFGLADGKFLLPLAKPQPRAARRKEAFRFSGASRLRP